MSARLRVEQRLVATVSLAGMVHFALASVWTLLALSPAQRAPLAEPGALAVLVGVSTLATLAAVVHVALRLPEARWPRADGQPGPSPIPLTVVAPLGLLVWPLLRVRDRRASARAHDPQEIELGFRQLLGIPRIAATKVGVWLAIATVVDAVWIASQSPVEVPTLVATTLLAGLTLIASCSLMTSRVRAMLLADYVATPRPDPLALPSRRNLALRLGGPAGLALLAAVAVPTLVGLLWSVRVSATVATAADRHMGLFVIALALGLLAGLAALALLLRDVERDVDRASRQVAAVADGEIPEPMAVDTFATAELRVLVRAVDRLVGRITDANVAKYVAIEKGQEAERLKSQFLANMSHDLRSPLNSVIGFSDLLLTGIEGELPPAQRERVVTIHRTGKALLQQIDDILDTAKIEAGRMELHREPTPPATLIARAIQRARVRLAPDGAGQGSPVDFDTTFAPGLPPAFMDPYRTVQAIENVLLFAAEGLESGRVEITCESPASKSVRELVIRIVSPHASVPLAQLEQARKGFFRLPGQTGLGLNLPIATSILELQGGSLTIEDGSSSSLNGRAALAFELRMPALSPRRVPRPRVQLGTRTD